MVKTTGTNHQHHAGCQHGHDSGPAIDRAYALFRKTGLKITRPRQVLIDAIGHVAAPFSAEDLFQATGLDLVTVYRTLATLSDLGVLAKVDLGDSVLRYEIKDPTGSHHHHVICNSCRKVEPLDLCQVEGLESRLGELGYTGLTHRLEFFGLCPDCSAQAQL